MENLRKEISAAMEDMLQKNIPCRYEICGDGWNMILNKEIPVNAYMKTVQEALDTGNAKCFMAPERIRAAAPVFEVKNFEIYLEGVKLEGVNLKDFRQVEISGNLYDKIVSFCTDELNYHINESGCAKEYKEETEAQIELLELLGHGDIAEDFRTQFETAVDSVHKDYEAVLFYRSPRSGAYFDKFRKVEGKYETALCPACRGELKNILKGYIVGHAEGEDCGRLGCYRQATHRVVFDVDEEKITLTTLRNLGISW